MEEVTELQRVPNAHVPVMKFKFQGISIDLLYASISRLVVPEVSSKFSFLKPVLFWFFVLFFIYHVFVLGTIFYIFSSLFKHTRCIINFFYHQLFMLL